MALIRITTPYFCAGVISKTGKIVRAAPILRWTIGKKVKWLRDYSTKREWQFEQIALSQTKDYKADTACLRAPSRQQISMPQSKRWLKAKKSKNSC